VLVFNESVLNIL